MKVVLLAVLSLAAGTSALFEVESAVGYHERVAIPLAKKIRAAENALIRAENRNARVVGGVPSTNPNNHPWLGGLLVTYENRTGVGVCGSALVSRNRLVTAAHCWWDGQLQADRFVVVLGTERLFTGGRRIVSTWVHTYPGWDPVTMLNNLAVIRLPTQVILSESIQPIALANAASETFAGSSAIVSGFGFTNDNKTSVPVLAVVNQAVVQVITEQQCRAAYGNIIQANTLCTSGEGGVGACAGDGGSPLVVIRNEQPLLIAVSTFVSARGCEVGLPSGYSRISSFYDFISQFL